MSTTEPLLVPGVANLSKSKTGGDTMVDIPGYTLISRLQSTSRNVLYHAVRDSDRLPAIVKMPLAANPGPRELERYRREHAILQRLREVRGVSGTLGCELSNGRPVLLLDGEAGAALSESVGRPFDVDRFLELAISLASTLADIHRRGVIHKDLKPSNIILLPSGEPRIIDFGSATLQSVEHMEAGPANLIEGTLAYMSPEQTGRMNRSVDYRTDLYSLGVTFYELLTGTLPFHGRDALEWFHAHMAQAPKPPHERVLTIPRSLSAIVMKLLAKVAEERYQGADGLKADLLRCQKALGQGRVAPFPLGEHDVPTHFQMPQRLYGREAQVDTLLQAFERVARGGRPELVLISGYSGIGKSAVVHELYRPVVQRRGLFLDGKFDQFQRDIPYATLAQAIRVLVRQLLASSDSELEAWRERLQEAWDGNGQLLVDVVPQLELVAGKQPALPELSPSEAQHRFDRVLQRFLGVLSTPEHPLVLFFDDLQWADVTSLRLLRHLLNHPDTPPVLLIGAYRDNEVSPSHPLMLVREELVKGGARVTDLPARAAEPGAAPGNHLRRAAGRGAGARRAALGAGAREDRRQPVLLPPAHAHAEPGRAADPHARGLLAVGRGGRPRPRVFRQRRRLPGGPAAPASPGDPAPAAPVGVRGQCLPAPDPGHHLRHARGRGGAGPRARAPGRPVDALGPGAVPVSP